LRLGDGGQHRVIQLIDAWIRMRPRINQRGLIKRPDQCCTSDRSSSSIRPESASESHIAPARHGSMDQVPRSFAAKSR
jgi:hypothetical protein